MRFPLRHIKRCLYLSQSPEGLGTGADPMGKQGLFWQSRANFGRARRLSWPNAFTPKTVATNAPHAVAF